jgi:hypothetical protein
MQKDPADDFPEIFALELPQFLRSSLRLLPQYPPRRQYGSSLSFPILLGLRSFLYRCHRQRASSTRPCSRIAIDFYRPEGKAAPGDSGRKLAGCREDKPERCQRAREETLQHGCRSHNESAHAAGCRDEAERPRERIHDLARNTGTPYAIRPLPTPTLQHHASSNAQPQGYASIVRCRLS